LSSPSLSRSRQHRLTDDLQQWRIVIQRRSRHVVQQDGVRALAGYALNELESESPLDGGEQERDLKSRFDELAKKFRVSAPRIAAILRSIGNDYKVDAIYMDRLADEVDLI
jgi:hypothetical protein